MTELGDESEVGVEVHLNLATYCRGFALRMAPGDIVLIGGLSRSGKTTLANNLRLAVLERGCNVWTLSLDRWLRDVDSRLPGVLGRYDLSIIRGVIAQHSMGERESQCLQLPQYHKLQQRTFFTGESILIQPQDILIVEGTVALTLATNLDHIHRLFVAIDESVRKGLVIDEYLSRGKSQFEAETVYAVRQLDETPVVERSSVGVTNVNIRELCSQ
jgi:uridine kinase